MSETDHASVFVFAIYLKQILMSSQADGYLKLGRETVKGKKIVIFKMVHLSKRLVILIIFSFIFDLI